MSDEKDDGSFYADDDRVYRRPVRRKNGDGTSDISMGFWVCTAGPGVKAIEIAEALNHDQRNRRNRVWSRND